MFTPITAVRPVAAHAHRTRVHEPQRPGSPPSEDPAMVVEVSPEAAEELAGDEHIDPGPTELTEAEQDLITQLKARDQEVRAHESAHMSAGGAAAGGASYTYQSGPDGNQYAIGGEVPIAIDTGGSPEQVISNAQQVRAAALAPAQPSSQDMSVAAMASQIEMGARSELAQEKQAELAEQLKPEEAPELPGTTHTEPTESEDATKNYGGRRADGQDGHTHSGADCGFCAQSTTRYRLNAV